MHVQPRALESLERRLSLSCTVAVIDGAGGPVLHVVGDEMDNHIELTGDSERGVSLTCDGDARVEFNGIRGLRIDAGGGNDTIQLDLDGVWNLLEIAAGSGDDVTHFDAHVHTIAEWFFDDPANLFAPRHDYGEGNDRATVVLTTDVPLPLHLAADLDDGNDSLDMDVSGPFAADAEVNTGGGNDRGVIHWAGLSSLVRNIDLGPGNDAFVEFYEGHENLGGNVSGALEAGPGNDVVVFRAIVPTPTLVDLHFELGGGNDAFLADVAGRASGAIAVGGGAGNDLITLVNRLPDIELTVSGGPGFDRLILVNPPPRLTLREIEWLLTLRERGR